MPESDLFDLSRYERTRIETENGSMYRIRDGRFHGEDFPGVDIESVTGLDGEHAEQARALLAAGTERGAEQFSYLLEDHGQPLSLGHHLAVEFRFFYRRENQAVKGYVTSSPVINILEEG